jgi:hypothetical protein
MGKPELQGSGFSSLHHQMIVRSRFGARVLRINRLLLALNQVGMKRIFNIGSGIGTAKNPLKIRFVVRK